MSVLFVLAAQAASPVCTTPAECAGQGSDTYAKAVVDVCRKVNAAAAAAGG